MGTFAFQPGCSSGWCTLRSLICATMLMAGSAAVAVLAGSQQAPVGVQEGAQQGNRGMTPAQRAAATRAFLGLGAVPDKAAAERGEPMFQQNCAFCHGPKARGATGPSLITSDVVLSDDHGEHLAPFLKKGVLDKGMPAFANMTDEQLTDICRIPAPAGGGRGESRGLSRAEHRGGGCGEGASLRGKPLHVLSHRGDVCAHRRQVPHARPNAAQLGVAGARRDDHGQREDHEGTICGTRDRTSAISASRCRLASGETKTIDRGPGVEVRIDDPLEGARADRDDAKERRHAQRDRLPRDAEMRVAAGICAALIAAAAVPARRRSRPYVSVDPGTMGKAPVTSWPTFNGDYSGAALQHADADRPRKPEPADDEMGLPDHGGGGAARRAGADHQMHAADGERSAVHNDPRSRVGAGRADRQGTVAL